MITILLGILSAIVVIAGVAYIVYSYAPDITNITDQIQTQIDNITAIVPEWLAPFIAVVSVIFIFGIIIKLL